MMAMRPYTDEYLCDYSAEHLYYEVRMLFEMVERLKDRPADVTAVAPPPPGELRLPAPVHNALIESFMARLLNLTGFIWNDDPGPTDVVASDYCVEPWRPRPSELLAAARVRMNSELDRLTTDRISGSPSRKRWDVEMLADALGPALLQFAEQASPKRLSVKARHLIVQMVGEATAVS